MGDLRIRCFACNKALVREFEAYLTDRERDGTSYRVSVGPECLGYIKRAGVKGYQPPKGGPRIYYDPPQTEESKQ